MCTLPRGAWAAGAGPLGSPGFIAPEIVMGEPHTVAMDVFSLGVVLFIMLVGRKPFNIRECETLSYTAARLEDAAGLRDPRHASAPAPSPSVPQPISCTQHWA